MKKNYSILFLSLIFFLFSSCGQKDYKRINEIGDVGVGIITYIEDTHVTVNNNPQVLLHLDIYSLRHDTFEGSVKMVVSRVNIPSKGDWVTVKFDPNDTSKVVYIKDKDMTPKVEEQIKEIKDKK